VLDPGVQAQTKGTAGLAINPPPGLLVALGAVIVAYILGLVFFILDGVRTLKQHKHQIGWVSWYAVTGMVALLIALLLLLALSRS